MSRPSPTGTLVVGFLLVLLCWSVLAGFITSVEVTSTDKEIEEAPDLLAWLVIGGFFACVSASLWLGGLVTKTLAYLTRAPRVDV